MGDYDNGREFKMAVTHCATSQLTLHQKVRREWLEWLNLESQAIFMSNILYK